MATLSDVAKEANVSKMTVSRVINHPEQVTPHLRELVEKAMRKLDYHPNSVARALVHNRSNVVNFVTLEDIDTTEPYYMNLLFGIARALAKKGYAFQLVTDPGQIMKNRADGYLITGARKENYDMINNLDGPVVLFGENDYGFDFVDSDNCLGEKLATQYALECNYDKIIFLGIDVDETFEKSRESGYIKTMKKAGKQPTIYRIENHSHAAQKVINDHFSKFEKNTCFICASDRIAIGVVRELASHGVNIPEDFGVIGFDGVFLDQVSNPKLTTIRHPIFEMGQLLADMVLDKIDQNGKKQGQVLLEPALVKRNSTR